MISEASSETLDRRYVAYGGAAELIAATELEVLADSGAGTGKSLSLLRKADLIARTYPNSRQFFARDTRKSLSESVLELFETEVLWPDHPAMTGTATRAHREKYSYPHPQGNADIVLISLEEVDRHMSARFDRGYIFEAHETDETTYEKLLTRLRNFKTPYHQLCLDVNPQGEYHWINQRFPRAGEANPRVDISADGDVLVSRRRVLFLHQDNPVLFDHKRNEWTKRGREYLATQLGALTGATRERLLNHRWVNEEGQILPQFDPNVHCVYRKDVPELLSYTASMDFGINNPAVLQIWGYDKEQNGYRVAEVYRRGWTVDQWADAAIALHREFPYTVGVGDCAAAGDILYLNKRLRAERGEDFGWVPCDKSKGKMNGIALLQDLLRRRSIFFVKDALRFGSDDYLRLYKRPLCTEQEIPAWVWLKNEDGKEIKEKPAPGPNHGIDAAIYNAVYKWGRDINPTPKKWDFDKPKPGTLSVADAMGFLEIAEKENW